MPKITLANCKAPSWEEFPKLSRIGADKVFAEAESIKRKIAELEADLKRLAPKLRAKLEAGTDEDTKSILYGSLLLTKKEGYVRRSLDTKWAIKKLVAKGVRRAEIEEHTKETEIDPTVSVQLLGAGAGEDEEES